MNDPCSATVLTARLAASLKAECRAVKEKLVAYQGKLVKVQDVKAPSANGTGENHSLIENLGGAHSPLLKHPTLAR